MTQPTECAVVGIVPSYQPDEKLEQTLRRMKDVMPQLSIIVVDDGGG